MKLHMHAKLYKKSKYYCCYFYSFSCMFIRYLRLFWEQFYVTKDESSHEGEGKKWSDRLKQLTWKNQLDKFEFEGEQGLVEEVKKKASAWFRVTYEPWIFQINKYKKKQGKNLKQITNQQQKEDSNDFKPPLFSFAWIVYPVLLDMCDERYAIAEPTLKRRKRRHKKNKKKIDNIPMTTTNSNE